jgi:hypothetical protein
MVPEGIVWSVGLSSFSLGLSLGIVLMRLANWLDARGKKP